MYIYIYIYIYIYMQHAHTAVNTQAYASTDRPTVVALTLGRRTGVRSVRLTAGWGAIVNRTRPRLCAQRYDIDSERRRHRLVVVRGAPSSFARLVRSRRPSQRARGVR